ncbi:hypothetical protein TNCT_403181 [Trichonephila clavata]|uniref:Uncharacterized protein n=1 Tax=Trichonephila clavata TaxID=2740835 RepID=A0A8X6HEH3_TRICU|nr:hypothetical protein TNCT_403181 [Trichonephila clavata]
MELVFQQYALYSTIQCLQPVMTAGYLPEQKMHPSTTKQWFKLSMNILRTLKHRLPYDKAVLETSRQHPYSFRANREKIVYPLSPPWISVSAVQHTPCPLDYKMLQTCQWTS